jgi:hypothetical protein
MLRLKLVQTVVFKAALTGPHAPPPEHVPVAPLALRSGHAGRPAAGADSDKPSGPPKNDSAEGM